RQPTEIRPTRIGRTDVGSIFSVTICEKLCNEPPGKQMLKISFLKSGCWDRLYLAPLFSRSIGGQGKEFHAALERTLIHARTELRQRIGSRPSPERSVAPKSQAKQKHRQQSRQRRTPTQFREVVHRNIQQAGLVRNE